MSQSIGELGVSGSEALLLEVLDMPINFHRCFVSITGKVTAALLLSYLWWSSDEAARAHDGWISRPLEEIRDDTGLSRDELATARRILRDLAFLEERRHGMPPELAFRVNRDHVAHAIVERVRSAQTGKVARTAAQHPAGRLPH